MSKKVMTRSAADNDYLHRDFHVAADLGIAYIGNRYGDNGVKEYLRRYAAAYFLPLIEDIKARGLTAIDEYLKNIYKAEQASQVLSTKLDNGELAVEIDSCPAISFMKSAGHVPSHWYSETVATVFETIADKAGIGFKLYSYDPQSGKAHFTFFEIGGQKQ